MGGYDIRLFANLHAEEIYPAARVVDATIHDLRWTAAIKMASERLSPPLVVSKVLGHKSDHGGAASSPGS